MLNNSATGGYLAPAASPAPLEDQPLYEFLQAAVVGITGLAGDLVRPRWQAEPSLLPSAGTCWCAVGVTDKEADTFPFVSTSPAGQPAGYMLQRHETFTLACSFYDLGYSGQADYYAAVLRDGLAVPQNLEAMSLGGVYLVEVEDLTPAPVLLKTRWQYRVDLRVRLRREVDRTYPVLDVLTANVDLYTDDGQPPRVINAE